MVYCPNCGVVNDESAINCDRCSSPMVYGSSCVDESEGKVDFTAMPDQAEWEYMVEENKKLRNKIMSGGGRSERPNALLNAQEADAMILRYIGLAFLFMVVMIATTMGGT